VSSDENGRLLARIGLGVRAVPKNRLEVVDEWTVIPVTRLVRRQMIPLLSQSIASVSIHCFHVLSMATSTTVASSDRCHLAPPRTSLLDSPADFRLMTYKDLFPDLRLLVFHETRCFVLDLSKRASASRLARPLVKLRRHDTPSSTGCCRICNRRPQFIAVLRRPSRVLSGGFVG
jgi:hypothetical protein